MSAWKKRLDETNEVVGMKNVLKISRVPKIEFLLIIIGCSTFLMCPFVVSVGSQDQIIGLKLIIWRFWIEFIISFFTSILTRFLEIT